MHSICGVESIAQTLALRGLQRLVEQGRAVARELYCWRKATIYCKVDEFLTHKPVFASIDPELFAPGHVVTRSS
jgi:hypothetical protein